MADLDELFNSETELEFIGDSFCIRAAKYSKGQLTVQFERDSSIYTYSGVHVFVWSNLLRSISKGWFFNKYIKNRYSYSRG